MRLRLFIPLLVTACLREDGAFDGDTSSGPASTTVTPTSGSASTETSGRTTAGTTSTASQTGSSSSTEALTGSGPTTDATTTTGDTTGDASSTGTTGDATTGEPIDEPTLCGRLPFGAPQKLSGVNSSLHDMSPHISRDGCELFFIRGTEQDPYDWDIYRSEIQ